MELVNQQEYRILVNQISNTYELGRQRATQAVDTQLVSTYWEIGQYIVKFEQGGKAKAGYGDKLLLRLSNDLTPAYGKGFSLSNLKRMRQFYKLYPIGATLSHQLSWSHFVELLKIEDELERSFYEKQTINEKWSIRELIRQKKSSLFLRLAASKDKEGILQLAKHIGLL